MNINYIFLRHGHGCHNAINSLYNDGMISKETMRSYHSSEFYDPELTSIGVDASIHNGGVISKLLKSSKSSNLLDNLDLSTINIVGCSPLIRCMETAYYMTRKWKNPPNKIYVFPHLREIDESSHDKYSIESINIINSNSSYAMKSIEEQKKYLRENNILDFFDFSYVEAFYDERNMPGDINMFIKWFLRNFISNIVYVPRVNVFIVSHAGVLKDFSNEGYMNNSGFILKTTNTHENIIYDKSLSLNRLLPNDFYKDYDNSYFIKKNYKCNNRCSNMCNYIKKNTNDK